MSLAVPHQREFPSPRVRLAPIDYPAAAQNVAIGARHVVYVDRGAGRRRIRDGLAADERRAPMLVEIMMYERLGRQFVEAVVTLEHSRLSCILALKRLLSSPQTCPI